VRCERRCHRCLTVAVPLEDNLGLQFAPMHPPQEGHPSEDLWQREGQAEAVGEIMITAGPLSRSSRRLSRTLIPLLYEVGTMVFCE
jgi:hypothetical protein